MPKKTGSKKPRAASSRPGKVQNLPAARPAQEPPFCVVGLGASAGGLEALEQFFKRMPADSGLGFVVVQHLDPNHKSMMADLLARRTSMKVIEATNGVEVRRDTVYIIPPNRYLALSHKTLRVITPDSSSLYRSPIDFFFSSLAENMTEKAICIVLSGTGSDGALGLKAVKEAGGLTMVQEEASAKYAGMPHSALATGYVDYVLPVEAMPAEIVKYSRHAYVSRPVQPERYETKGIEYFEKIFSLLRQQTGHDFSNYKRHTIGRRIERRMALHEVDDLGHYVRYLERHKEEVYALFKEFLIGVTGFFRDPEAFDLLKEEVIPRLFDPGDSDRPVRIWVAGCSTGEEAYSVAMLLFEHAEKMGRPSKGQIFATDIDPVALDIARNGIYSEPMVSGVSPGRLKAFFRKEGNAFRIKKDLRDIVIFAKQDLIKDPPFSRLDLILCRNLLIYFGSVLQKKILPLFHYTLNPEGFLMLGPSETIGEFADLFSLVNKRWRLFQRKSVPRAAVDFPTPPLHSGVATQPKTKAKGPSDANVIQLTEKILLESYAPSYVIINEKNDIIHFYGRTGRYLEPPTGNASLNILKMAREGLRIELRSALHKARKGKTPLTYPKVRVKSNGSFYLIDLIVKPLEKESLKGLMMVIFSEAKVTAEDENAGQEEMSRNDHRVLDLEQELNSTKESLQTTIEELETSNEELKSTNEELQSTNEELQSTNEELETSKEELQSINEELITVNAELQIKLDELSEAHNDITNLLASTDIATVFLDSQLQIKRFTPAIAPVVSLIAGDIGRPISHLANNLQDEQLTQDAKEVLGTLASKEKEVRSKNGDWYRMRMVPYRTSHNVIDGIVVSFLKMTDLKKAEEGMRTAFKFSRDLVDAIPLPLLVLNKGLKVVMANAAYYKVFRAGREEVLGQPFYTLRGGEWNVPSLRKFLNEVVSREGDFKNFELEHAFEGIGRRKIKLTAGWIKPSAEGASGRDERILLVIEENKNV